MFLQLRCFVQVIGLNQNACFLRIKIDSFGLVVVNLLKVKWSGKKYTAIEIAREAQEQDIVTLLEEFKRSPAKTRQQLRQQMQIAGKREREIWQV